MLLQALCIISWPLVKSNWSYSPETLNLGQNRWFLFVPCDLEIWRRILKSNRAPLLCCLKPCASFCSHLWIKTGVTVRKHPVVSKSAIFGPLWPWNFMDDIEKQQGTSPMPHQAMYITSLPYVNSNCYSPETANLGFGLCELDLWPLT